MSNLLCEVCIGRLSCLKFRWPLKPMLIRCCSSSAQQRSTNPPSRAPTSKKTDESDANWVRPPHPVSNLRLIEYKNTRNESDVEKRIRNEKIQVQNWNQEFWSKHNSKFFKERKEFIVERKKELGNDNNAVLPPDEMSRFYKKFLDDNYKDHINYNKEWYKKNIRLLMASFVAILYRFLRHFSSIKRKS